MSYIHSKEKVITRTSTFTFLVCKQSWLIHWWLQTRSLMTVDTQSTDQSVAQQLTATTYDLLSYFFVKKYLLVGASSMLRTGQWISQSVSEWVSQWVRDVCMSHQSDRIYYKQSIKFLVLKVNGMWEDSIPTQFRTAIFILLWKRRKYLFPHFLWVMLRILVMDEMGLEVWDSAWACCMQMALDIFIFSYKGNMILLFFTRSKFN